MTSRERIATLLSGGVPDRLPWWPEINAGFIGNFARAEGLTCKSQEVETHLCRRIGADQLLRVVSVKESYEDVDIERHEAPDESVLVYHTPHGDLRQVQKPGPEAGTVYTTEHLLKGPQDFRAFGYLYEHLKLEPDYADVYYNLAIVAWKKKDFEEAERLLLTALQKKPDYKAAKSLLKRINKGGDVLD